MPHLMINGIKEEFETFGDIHNPPLILLYGGATHSQTWRIWHYNNTIEKLAKENYVIAFDRRGHGSSRFPTGSTMEDAAKDVIALMDALCIEKANVVGQSAGTYVLGCAAGIAPERFNSMILLVPHSHSFNGSPATHLMRSSGVNPVTATREEMNAFFRNVYSPNTTDEFIQKYREWVKPLEQYPSLPAEDTAAAYKSIANFDNRENFKKLNKPVLVISGQHDLYCPPHIGRAIAESIEGGRFVELENCGHALFTEKNEECVELMLDFLRSVN